MLLSNFYCHYRSSISWRKDLVLGSISTQLWLFSAKIRFLSEIIFTRNYSKWSFSLITTLYISIKSLRNALNRWKKDQIIEVWKRLAQVISKYLFRQKIMNKVLWKRKEIKKNWTGTKISDNCFFVIINCYYKSLTSRWKTGL